MVGKLVEPWLNYLKRDLEKLIHWRANQIELLAGEGAKIKMMWSMAKFKALTQIWSKIYPAGWSAPVVASLNLSLRFLAMVSQKVVKPGPCTIPHFTRDFVIVKVKVS